MSQYLLLVLVSVTALVLHLHHHLLQFLLCTTDDFVGCCSLPESLKQKKGRQELITICIYCLVQLYLIKGAKSFTQDSH